ncbi:four helix bundle protein [Arthrospiribacter ruber]|uniref:Four helix bundle protein n=1 Tax=Arthrospiribacter ruber TaxID=2487934 RepID=A0A951IW21_9BACT|nr:four helix bundle protein [Arthrospiribacter ruber]MBW3466583.1 four helix bundle protein [Arthrospiribacter ruber]
MKAVIVEKTLLFAEKILNVYFFLREHKHYRLAEQIVGSGTSIGANVIEAQAAQSKKDFISKMSIASKEARETEFWLKLFNRKDLLMDHPDYKYLSSEIVEIIKILNAILVTSKRRE